MLNLFLLGAICWVTLGLIGWKAFFNVECFGWNKVILLIIHALAGPLSIGSGIMFWREVRQANKEEEEYKYFNPFSDQMDEAIDRVYLAESAEPFNQQELDDANNFYDKTVKEFLAHDEIEHGRFVKYLRDKS